MQIPPSSDSRFSIVQPLPIQLNPEVIEKFDIEVVVLDALQPGKRVVRIEVPRSREREIVGIIEKALNVRADIRHMDY